MAWKQVVLCGADKDQTLVAFKMCQSFISEACELVRAEDLTIRVYNIAVETRTAFYDSLFLARQRQDNTTPDAGQKAVRDGQVNPECAANLGARGTGFASRSAIMDCRSSCG